MVFDELSARLAEQTRQLDALVASDVAAFLTPTETSARSAR
jgi:hypothetical protein